MVFSKNCISVNVDFNWINLPCIRIDSQKPELQLQTQVTPTTAQAASQPSVRHRKPPKIPNWPDTVTGLLIPPTPAWMRRSDRSDEEASPASLQAIKPGGESPGKSLQTWFVFPPQLLSLDLLHPGGP